MAGVPEIVCNNSGCGSAATIADHLNHVESQIMTQPSPPKTQMYSSSICPYCMMASRLLSSKGVDVEILDVDRSAALRAQMQARTGRTSVPQIFIGETHVGGCDDLHALDRAGKLDALLAGTA